MAEKTVPSPTETPEATTRSESTRESERYVAPPVDIYETDEGLVLLADLPGVAPDQLKVDVKEDILTIEAHPSAELQGTPVVREFELCGFFRQFQLNERIDVNRITAKLKHGVLTLTLPKAEEARPKKIKVEIA